MPRSALVKLTPNVPQQIMLASDGLPDRSGENVRFPLVDGRTLLLDLDTAQRLNELEVNLEKPFWICLKWQGTPEEAPYLDLWLDPITERKRAAEEAPELERQLRESLSWAQTRKRKGPAAAPKAARVQTPAQTSDVSELLSFEDMLVTQSKTLTDAFAKVLEHAQQYPAMRPEDVRSLFLSVYINCSPRGYRRSAA